VIHAAEKTAEAAGAEACCDYTRASTGTVYLTVELTWWLNEGDEAEEIRCETRIYRFAAHGECYDSHDYSVWSGGGASAKATLPPGYDGVAADAVRDVKRWIQATMRAE